MTVDRNTKKKVLFIITKSYFGGAQRYVYELASSLPKEHYEVTVACAPLGPLVDILTAAGIVVLPIHNFERDIKFGKDILALFEIIRYIRQIQPDIIHLNSSKAGGLGALAGRLLRVPKIVFTAHGWPFLEPKGRLWRFLAWSGSYITGLLSHEIILVSSYDRQHMHMPFLSSRCSVIHTAVAAFPLLPREESRRALFPPELIATHERDIWLITHGELNLNKNHAVAIDAVAEFNATHQTKIFYTIIGSGETQGELEEQVSFRGLTDYVQFLGYKPDARQYLYAFDIYLMPSKKEGLPYALLEAAYAGLPCIGSLVGGIPEVIYDYQTGLLISPHNHMTIVAALDYLLTNADKRAAYSTALTAHVLKTFNQSTLMEKTIALYER